MLGQQLLQLAPHATRIVAVENLARLDLDQERRILGDGRTRKRSNEGKRQKRNRHG